MQGIDLAAALPVILQTHPHRQGEQAGKAFLERLDRRHQQLDRCRSRRLQ
jgi:hypothetical protein